MKSGLLAGALAAATLLGAAQAQSATSLALFNTGTDAAAVGEKFGYEDNHYSIFSSTAPNFQGVVGGQAVTYEHDEYIDGDEDSYWISGRADGDTGRGPNDPATTTTYRLTFNIGQGLSPFTATISGAWGTDNEGEIFLNGNPTGIKLFGSVPGAVDLDGHPNDYDSFRSLHNFSISKGFVTGENHLDFVVQDLGQPSALRVDNLAGTAAVPEPASWAMMILGFFGLGGALRAQRRTAAAA